MVPRGSAQLGREVLEVEIIRGVVQRITGDRPEPNITPAVIVATALTFVVRLGVAVFEARAARRLNSNFLRADALHVRTDLFVTPLVVVSLVVNRLGFGAMRLTGPGMWGEFPDREAGLTLLRRVVQAGVNFIDTADAYGPHTNESLIHDALHP